MSTTETTPDSSMEVETGDMSVDAVKVISDHNISELET